MILRRGYFTQPRNLTPREVASLNSLFIQLFLLGREDLKDVHLINPLMKSDSKSQFHRLTSLNFPPIMRSLLIT